MGLVVAFEACLHLVPGRHLLGYGQGIGAYLDVRHTIESAGAADVVVLGTSRGRESVVLPVFRKLLSEEAPTTVASYACAGANASEMLQITRLMLESRHRPKVVVYFVSPTMIKDANRDRSRTYLLGAERPDAVAVRPFALSSYVAAPLHDVRSWFDKHLLAVRHRQRFRYVLQSAIRGRKPLSAVQGDETVWQTYAAGRSLVTHPVSDQRVRDYVVSSFGASGSYRIGEEQLQAFKRTIEICIDNGIDVHVVYAAMSDILAANLPSGTATSFEQAVTGVLAPLGMGPIAMADLGVTLGPADFREQSHLNRTGAVKVTNGLAAYLRGATVAAADYRGREQTARPAAN